MVALEIVFWACVALLIHTHVGYPLTLWLLSRAKRGSAPASAAAPAAGALPSVSLIVAAHDEEETIEAKLRDALALDYPRERLELIVASDGSEDRTAELARSAGADLVLELPRLGKLAAQNAAVERSRGEVLAFSDANARWERGALRALVEAVSADGVGYACGAVRFLDAGGSNQEGAYWRYELWVRSLESGLAGITAGNGAIYAVRRDAYLALEPSRSHDLSFPFQLTKRNWRAVFARSAVAAEKPVPTLEGEFRRKRRMMRGLWGIVVSDRMASPRGYSPLYAYEIASHRLVRYLSPLLHVVALAANVALLGEGWVYTATLIVQLAFLAAAALGSVLPFRPLRLAYYYVLVTASIAAGFWDRVRGAEPATWEKAEGTR